MANVITERKEIVELDNQDIQTALKQTMVNPLDNAFMISNLTQLKPDCRIFAKFSGETLSAIASYYMDLPYYHINIISESINDMKSVVDELASNYPRLRKAPVYGLYNKTINSFIEIGFSTYEAKAYCSLLIQNPATAYEIAKESFIPTSKVYEVLSKLLEKEVILEIVDNNKKKYIPVDPDDFIERYKTSTNNTLKYLSTSLNTIKKEEDVSGVVS